MKKSECPGCYGHTMKVHGLIQAMLLLLLHEEPGHGYDLMKRLDRELPSEMIPDQAVVYRILRELERVGFVASILMPGEGGPGRKVYSVKAGGRVFLDEWYRLVQSRVAALNRFIGKYEQMTVSPKGPVDSKDEKK